jgi:hypothetical protein
VVDDLLLPQYDSVLHDPRDDHRPQYFLCGIYREGKGLPRCFEKKLWQEGIVYDFESKDNPGIGNQDRESQVGVFEAFECDGARRVVAVRLGFRAERILQSLNINNTPLSVG